MNLVANRADEIIRQGGPWTHRDVSAGGHRFHAVEIGDGPLVLFLHGFPEFWWAWRHQLTSLAESGRRAVAVDLRGYGGSDKPPRGYDLITLAGDVAGIIRALGERNAVLVGHGTGGLIGWTAAVYNPHAVRRLIAVSAPHPLRLRQAFLTDHRQAWAMRDVWTYQLPVAPERRLIASAGAAVGAILRDGSADGWPDQKSEDIYREAIQLPGVAHSALEYHRWMVRSLARPDGIRYARHMRTPVTVPALQIHGAADPIVLPRTAQGSGRHVIAPYRWRMIDDAGHFPHEERPDAFSGVLVDWLTDDRADR